MEKKCCNATNGEEKARTASTNVRTACWEMKPKGMFHYLYLGFMLWKSIWLLQLVLCTPHL